jgi:hypothetical protein
MLLLSEVTNVENGVVVSMEDNAVVYKDSEFESK